MSTITLEVTDLLDQLDDEELIAEVENRNLADQRTLLRDYVPALREAFAARDTTHFEIVLGRMGA